jgi:hypothetical protein
MAAFSTAKVYIEALSRLVATDNGEEGENWKGETESLYWEKPGI